MLFHLILILSFFPWILLFSLILFVLNRFIPINYLTPVVIILDSLLKPYITLSTLVFYESIDETTKKSKKRSKKEKEN